MSYRLFGGACLVLLATLTHAQQWTKKWELPLSDTLKVRELEWLSLNADTVLDVALLGERRADLVWLLAFERTASTWALRSKTPIAQRDVTIQRIDWNKDGRQDFVLRGRDDANRWTLTAYENQGDFTWKKQPIAVVSTLPQFRIADADGDGEWDIFFFGNTGMQVLLGGATGFTQAYVREGVSVRDIALFHFLKTPLINWIVSGVAAGKPFTRVLVPNHERVVKELDLPRPVDGLLAYADYDGDGWFDVSACGRDSAGLRLRTWYGSPNGFSRTEARPGLHVVDYLAANLNEDKGVEQILVGADSLGIPRAWWLDSLLVRRELPWANAILTRLADQDRDGDLDGFTLIDSLSQSWIQWHENNTQPRDQRPTVPSRPAAFSLYGQTLLFWQPATDDRTQIESITYDVWLGRQSRSVISPTFDLNHLRRTASASGNAGNRTVFRVQNLPDDRYFYTIQAVDNALNGSYSVCAGGVLPCFDLQETHRQVCENETVRLLAPGPAAWYSVRTGFLSEGQEYEFTASQTDTLFSIVPQSTVCADHRVWIVQVNPASQKLRELRYVCENTAVELGIPAGWPQIRWQTMPVITNRDTIRYRVRKDEKITVVATGPQCELEKEFDLRISKPVITAPTEAFRSLKGNEVTLAVTATPGSLRWSPTTGLEQPNAATTVAVPPRTTTYVVTLTDSVGCQAQVALRVDVDFTAFVPNLFSPNADDNNDRLLLYGLDSNVRDFRFQIFNREGSLVYDTEDPQQATGIGWNGFAQGVRQAAGMYYWKVSGQTAEGEALLLNGKKSGHVLVVY
jgi:gliding motility-associated-like protein